MGVTLSSSALLDIGTGEVLFEWHSLEHVGLDESYTKHFDYFHINSIDVYDEDHLLISSRSTCTVYKVSRKTGQVVWRLGGKKSDFEMGPGTRTTFQHDARRQGDGTITIFDNGNVMRHRLHTRSTKLSTTRFSPALSNWMVSLLPSMAVTLPLPNFW